MEKELWTIDDIIKDYEDKGLAGRSKIDFLKDLKDFILKNTRYVLVPSMSAEEQEKFINEIREKMKDKNFGSTDYSNPGLPINEIYLLPKKYLKWEDLEFTYDEQKIKVRLNGENYTVVYFKMRTYDNHSGYEYVGILKYDDIIVYSINGCWNTTYLLKQFFDALHLEVIENE